MIFNSFGGGSGVTFAGVEDVWSFTASTKRVIYSVAVDKNGYVYAGEGYGYNLHKITPSGDLVWSYENTDNINDIAIGEDGYIYFADGDATVKKIDSSGNLDQTFNGYGSSGTNAVAVDADGYVYAASSGASVGIMKRTPSNAKSWSAGINGNCLVLGTEYVYYGDSTGGVYKYTTSGSKVWQYLYDKSVESLGVDSSGNVYGGTNNVSNNCFIFKLNSNGTSAWSHTYETETTGAKSGITSMVIDEYDYIYISDGDGYVKKLSTDNSVVWSYAAHSKMIYDIALDADGYIYTASSSPDYSVKKIQQPSLGSLYIAPDKKTRYDVYEIGTVRFNLSDGDASEVWKYRESASYPPNNVVVAPDGKVYATLESEFYKFTDSGIGSSIVDIGQNIYDMAIHDNDTIYIGLSDQMQKITSKGAQLWDFTGMGTCYAVATDKDGYAYCGGYNYKLFKVTPEGEKVWETNTGYMVRGIAVDEQGQVYTCTNNNIRVHSSSGSQLSNFGTGSYASYCVALGDGYVYAGMKNGSVYKIINTKSSHPGNSTYTVIAHTSQVNRIAVDEDGYVYTASNDNVVQKIDPNGGTVWKFNNGTGYALCVDFDSKGYVYAGYGNGYVYKIKDGSVEIKNAAFYR